MSDFNYPVNICFECNGCGLCCGDTEQKTRRILLLESEANFISAYTDLPIKKFVHGVSNNSPYVYEMQKPVHGKCYFLEANKCTIYPLRPLICRFYPFELKYVQDQDTHVFNYTLECPTIGKGKTLTRKDFEELFSLAKEKLG